MMASSVQPTILIMAGGTGGHVFPALTIAQTLLAGGSRVEWLGTRAGIEARVVTNAAIPLHFIGVAGVRGKSLLRKLLAPFAILAATLHAIMLIRRINPCCVLGMGGYVTGPGGVAARLLGKPLLIHEQNAVAGMANVMLYPLAQVAMEGFAGAFARKRQHATDKVVVVGNPVRAEVLAVPSPQQRLAGRSGKLRLLVIGGSLGASVFNHVVPRMLASMGEAERPLLRHQCGRQKLTDTLAHYQSAGLGTGDGLEVSEFIDDMAAAYGWADVVLCRAGASTLAEITAIGLPAILVPYPHAADDHQAVNAAALERAGAARVLPQSEFNADTLRTLVLQFAGNRQQLQQQAVAAHGAGIRNAGEHAARLCLEACHG